MRVTDIVFLGLAVWGFAAALWLMLYARVEESE